MELPDTLSCGESGTAPQGSDVQKARMINIGVGAGVCRMPHSNVFHEKYFFKV